MINQSGNNLVFLLCIPRSGSSLATILLQNHSKVLATQEMWYLMSLHDLRHPENRPYAGTRIIDRFFNGMVTDEVFVRSARAFALETYNGLLQTSDAELIVDKSPRYYYILEFIDRLFPESKRIWLVRNPLSILASYKKVNQSKTPFSLLEVLHSPALQIKLADLTVGFFRYYHYFSASHPNSYRQSYETLVSDPKKEIERLCEFLHLSYEEGMESYGEQLNTSKGKMFSSMGVGDPYVYGHNQAHQDSIHIWRDLLDKQEIEAYCRLLGSRVFHQLGYSEVLQEAENITGVHFETEPDLEFIQTMTKRLIGSTGAKWEDNYQMQAKLSAAPSFFNKNNNQNSLQQLENEMKRLNITIQSLEHRLSTNHDEKNKLMHELQAVRNRRKRIKSFIPFSGFLTSLTQQKGQKK